MKIKVDPEITTSYLNEEDKDRKIAMIDIDCEIVAEELIKFNLDLSLQNIDITPLGKYKKSNLCLGCKAIIVKFTLENKLKIVDCSDKEAVKVEIFEESQNKIKLGASKNIKIMNDTIRKSITNTDIYNLRVVRKYNSIEWAMEIPKEISSSQCTYIDNKMLYATYKFTNKCQYKGRVNVCVKETAILSHGKEVDPIKQLFIDYCLRHDPEYIKEKINKIAFKFNTEDEN